MSVKSDTEAAAAETEAGNIEAVASAAHNKQDLVDHYLYENVHNRLAGYYIIARYVMMMMRMAAAAFSFEAVEAVEAVV